AGPEASDAMTCTASEVCGDGIDNDCNGKADCADPACITGWVCAPALPNGWQRVAYDPDQRPNCPSGYASPSDVGEGLVAPPATCTCGCTTTAPSCASGKLAITAGTTGMNGCQDKANQMETAAAGCQVLALPINAGGGQKMSIVGPAPTGGSCTPTGPTKMAQAPSFMHDGRVCTGGGIGSAGCTDMKACIPAPAPFEIC